MPVCEICWTFSSFDYFEIKSHEPDTTTYVACHECYLELEKPQVVKKHYIMQLCVVQYCLNIADSGMPIHVLCEQHHDMFEPGTCGRCCRLDNVYQELCQGCHLALSPQEFQAFRDLGDPEQLSHRLLRLKDYETLGSYEQLADLRSRADILDHCDELNIK